MCNEKSVLTHVYRAMSHIYMVGGKKVKLGIYSKEASAWKYPRYLIKANANYPRTQFQWDLKKFPQKYFQGTSSQRKKITMKLWGNKVP